MKSPLVGTAVLLLVVAVASEHTQAGEHAGWHQDVKYEIQARLDTTAKKLEGQLWLTYRNNSADTLRRVYLQVPANAFHHEANTAVREMRRFNRGSITFTQSPKQKLTIHSVQFLSIGDRTDFAVQAFDFSDTILDLPLPVPLAPRDTLSVAVSFSQGYVQLDFDLWFPRLAVYDEEGWHAEPFHFMMESSDVFSEFAEMDVTLTVPGDYIVVGSGVVLEGDPGWEAVTVDTLADLEAMTAWHDSLKQRLFAEAGQRGPRRVRFHADRLQNFIWSASADFIHIRHPWKKPIDLFFRSGPSLGWAKTVLANVDTVLQSLEDQLGPYPLPHLAIVQSDIESAQPMMILTPDVEDFSLVFALASVVVPGIVGINGVEEAWMSKGLALYLAKEFIEKKHGKHGYNVDEIRKDMNLIERQYPLPSVDTIFRTLARLYMDSGQNEPIANSIHKYRDPVGMVSNVYLKSSLLYEMLRFVVGDTTLMDILREFTRRYAFHHAREADFVEVCEQVSGQELDWFFDEWLHGTPLVDYEKGKVRQYRRKDGTWVTEVEVRRKGDGIMPVDVELDLGSNEKIVKRWDGRAESGVVVFQTAQKPRKVEVDPRDRIMDANLLNNRRLRIEFKPDLPLMKYVYMPADAYLLLYRPTFGYNTQDNLRLGLRTHGSYRAFYNNLTLDLAYGFGSKRLDGAIAYDHPLRRDDLLSRYSLMARRNEGRYELDAHLELKRSDGILSTIGTRFQLGINYSGVDDPSYTFRQVSNDTGRVRLEEWDDVNVLLLYAEAGARLGWSGLDTETRLRAEMAVPGGDAKFSKTSARVEAEYSGNGLRLNGRLNGAISFGPDPLPLQDRFHAEGASARERFRNDLVKTGGDWLAFARRYVEGGGFLRGYAGLPLPAERYATLNLEIGPQSSLAGVQVFGFWDEGRVLQEREGRARTLSGAGIGFSFLAGRSPLFGGNLALLSDFSARLYFPIWISDPPGGKSQLRFRWYVALGKTL